MIEKMSRLAGKIAPCSCGRQPFLVEVHGRPGALMLNMATVRSYMECPPCRKKTAIHDTTQEAVAEWEDEHKAEAVA
jgi:hypothetical protein